MKRLLARLGSELDMMRAEAEAAVLTELPELSDRVDAVVRRRVIEATIRRVLRRLEGHTGPDPDAETHRAFGAAAAYAGIPLERLAAGYRIGARIGWAHLRRAVRDLHLGGDIGLLLAEAQLAYVDELTSDSFDGYTRAVETAHHRHARERQSLIDALIAGRATKELAHKVGWIWPAEVAVAVIHGESAPDPTRGSEILVGTADGAVIGVGPAEVLEQTLKHQELATIGPTVETGEAWRSFERARQLANLVATGVLAKKGVLRWTEELPTIIIHGAPDAAQDLAARRLAPLRDSSAQRERMLRDTLAAWLDYPGQPQAIAEVLHLHPQTVRYRISRLRERLGSELDDPQARFELALALRYRGVRSGSASAPDGPA